MVEDQIRDSLLLRLEKLGYHLIRVKLITVNTKKTLQIMAERIKDKKMDIFSMCQKIIDGHNNNEILLVQKTRKNQGFFEKFFNFFS